MNCKFREFIEDVDGRGSSTRLSALLGVFVGSIINIWLAYTDKLGGDIFGIYMACTGGMYSFGKWRESVTDVAQIKADSPNQPPVPLSTPPATVIQVGQQSSDITAKDVSVQAEGNVTVKGNKKGRKA